LSSTPSIYRFNLVFTVLGAVAPMQLSKLRVP
jgi:hypothetical protein